LRLSSSSGLSSNDESKLPNNIFLIFFQSRHNFSAIPVFPSAPSKSCHAQWHSTKFELFFFGVARKRDLVFIAIGKLHMGLAWDIRVISRLQANRPDHLVEVD
jgi:hypothetical protein